MMSKQQAVGAVGVEIEIVEIQRDTTITQSIMHNRNGKRVDYPSGRDG